MLKKFFALEKAIEIHKTLKGLKLPYHLKDQLKRASSSIPQNLAEGSGKF